ncbi:MAG: hydroxyacylglutathione hydrolase [Alphaproteobacteria bacterium]
MDIALVPCFTDNYAYLLQAGDAVGVVDPGEAGPVLDTLERRGLALSHIFITHYHADHVGGIGALKERFDPVVVGPKAEAAKINGLDVMLAGGDAYAFGPETAEVIDTPAHTSGHISFHFPASKAVFVGDTLFALGCGRLFEGSAEQMWTSLSRLMALPDDTRVYCGHEYTQSNARFCTALDPDNTALASRAGEIDAARARGEPTIPTTIGLEKATSPFLRAGDPVLRARLGLADAADWEVFAEVRRRKDTA